jgi:predicted enzyme related to lactoylglutathione lyase
MTTWSTFSTESAKLGELTQQAMVNYRVDDMDALLADLEAKGVWIDPKRDDSEYGKFAWIKDCDGNRVELWQPLAE